jgi:hypothetical protein
MNLQWLCIGILLLATVLSIARLWHGYIQAAVAHRPRVWRILMLIALSSVCAMFLYAALFPPVRYVHTERLLILSAHADVSTIKNKAARVIALPEATKITGVERVPDLATALRRYPDVGAIDVIGDGLPLRDMDAARGLLMHFSPSQLSDGIQALSWSEKISPGMRWWLRGRVNPSQTTTLELLDPANVVIARQQSDVQGGFVFSDTARAAGQATYHVRVLNAQKKILETLTLPISVEREAPLRVLSLAGGPSPELKFLRRWARDADIALESRIELGQGMQIHTENSVISAANLQDLDLLILDERAWHALSSANKTILMEALNNGLGVLLRLTGTINSNTVNEWRKLGFWVSEHAMARSVRLHEPQGRTLLPELTRRPVRVQSHDAAVLLQTNNAEPLAIWRAQAQGRIALWWLTDSYKLALIGAVDRHAQLWSEAATILARARSQAMIKSQQQHVWVNARSIYCGLVESARVREPNGQVSQLVIDKHGANKSCAGFWPRQAGWHRLYSGMHSQAFYVRANGEASGLWAGVIRDATMQQVDHVARQSNPVQISMPGRHWPYFLLWLLLSSLLWVFERSKWGMPSTV